MIHNYENVYTICVPCKEKKGFYRLQTIWDDNQINITLLDDALAYGATTPRCNLERQASSLEMSFDVYIKKLLEALQNLDKSYLYQREDDKFQIFRLSGAIKIKLIIFNLEQKDYVEAVENFIDKINEIANYYKGKLEKSSDEQMLTNKEKTQAVQKLEKYIQLKEETESDLYSKFILLLNEKKKQIKRLNDLIEEYKKGKVQEVNEEKPNEKIRQTNKSKIKEKKIKDKDSFDSSDTEEDSDLLTPQIYIKKKTEEVSDNTTDDEFEAATQKIPNIEEKSKNKQEFVHSTEEIFEFLPQKIPNNSKNNYTNNVSTQNPSFSKKSKKLEVLSDSGSDTDCEIPEKITHKVQIEPKPSIKRNIEFLEEDVPKMSLPKRNKLSVSPNKDINVSSDTTQLETKSTSLLDEDEDVLLDRLFSLPQDLSQKSSFPNKLPEKNEENVSESMDFNTQQLLDLI